MMNQMVRGNGGAMSAVPTNVGVFFGQVDKRTKGWYWAETNTPKAAIRGPFETKDQAIEDALRRVLESPNETGERGAA
jgi:hypothetical protein